jgi:hypothetical protein
VLNLPEAFGSAYVGETFSCTLCANNELDPSNTTRSVSGVRIQGDMQTPSAPSGSPLELTGAEGEEEEGASPAPGESLQKILRFELKEEGNHVLAVTVTYTETALKAEGMAASGRVRTFRKLYQFVAQQLLSVRTKAGELGEGTGRFLLEAQLENMGEGAVSFEVCSWFVSLFTCCPRLLRAVYTRTHHPVSFICFRQLATIAIRERERELYVHPTAIRPLPGHGNSLFSSRCYPPSVHSGCGRGCSYIRCSVP